MLKNNKVYMGTLPTVWGTDKKIKNITFSITDECNLRCTYCYFKHKTHKNVMSFDTAKKAVDDILSDPAYLIFDGVVWEFIGGEPTIEMRLIDKISDYILYKMYKLDHKWLYCYRFMIGTNGLLYRDRDFQNYINKHNGNLSVAVTIDGSKEKHDLSRIKKDGTGSYDDVRKIIPLWQKQFGADSTKATFSHDDLPFLKDSIVNLWNIGLKCIAANIVFEDVWHDEDVQIFKNQLYALADYIIENDLWDDYSVRFFDPAVGTPYTEETMRRNTCGTGTMLAVNTNGDYYPCVRFMPSALTNNSFEKLGSIGEKIHTDRLRPFFALNVKNQSPDKCLKCDIAGGCSWCSGFNYDSSSVGTLFERQTFLCNMHKANVEVNKYLWRQYELTKHKISPYRYKKLTTISPYNKYLYVICNSNFPSFCEFPDNDKVDNGKVSTMYMDPQTIEKVCLFCDENNFVPIFCGCSNLPDDYYGHQLITYSDVLRGECKINNNYYTQLLFKVEEIHDNVELFGIKNIIVSVKASQINQLYKSIECLSIKYPGLNVNISVNIIDIDIKEYIYHYKKFLDDLVDLINIRWKAGNYLLINVITNEIFANTIRPCGSGYNNYTVSPEGNFYICAGFYKLFPNQSIGTLATGIDKKFEIVCTPDQGPLCADCDIRHCRRCVLKNKCGTGEYNLPTELQCVIAHMEYEYSRKIANALDSGEYDIPVEYNHHLKEIDFYDPIKKYRGSSYPNLGLDEYVTGLITR